MKKTAVLIDGGYFIKRIEYYLRKHYDNHLILASELKDIIWSIVKFHVDGEHGKHKNKRLCELFRIYYYDCRPPDNQLQYPLDEISTVNGEERRIKKHFNAKIHAPYILRNELHIELKKNRKTALRMGVLKTKGRHHWELHPDTLEKLIRKQITWDKITNNDFTNTYKQKGVDIKLGMDITHLSYEKLVDSIVLIAGDEDFVPAAKQARIKGVDFILDPLGGNVADSLNEHIDGIQDTDLIKSIHYVCGIEPTTPPDWWSSFKSRKTKKTEEYNEAKKRVKNGRKRRGVGSTSSAKPKAQKMEII